MFLSYKSKQIWINRRLKKEKRQARLKIKYKKAQKHRQKLALLEKRLKYNNIPYINAPECLALSPFGLSKKDKSTEHTKFIQFKMQLELQAKNAIEDGRNQIMISFANTRYLYADACVLLIATIDSLKTQYPQLQFLVKRPDRKLLNHRPNRHKYQYFNVDAVFCHIGFYKLLGYDYSTSDEHRNVKSWHYVFSDEANGDVTIPIFETLNTMGLDNLVDLYSGVIEGIANAMEHAYNEQIVTKRIYPLQRWWLLMAKLDSKLLIYICDLGHGISNTLRFNKDPTLLARVFELVKDLGTSDCKDIKAATLLRKTRTNLSHRGKGGKDIKTFIEKTNRSSMQIYSNRGVYRYTNNNGRTTEKLYDEKLSIGGTILHWSIPLQEENE